jgi:pimeloyl-ACP methyl ester carboxylesterase
MSSRSRLFKLMAVAAVAYAGWHWQRAGERRDRVRLLAPGRFVEAGGRRVHVLEAGVGSPTVVLVNGLGGSCLDWELVAPRVAGFTRVIRFDQPGLGWTEGPSPVRSVSESADALRAVLLASGARPPYMLVGWSTSCFDVRVFAGRYPGEVSGVVLVDPQHESVKEAFGLRASALLWGLKAFYGMVSAAGEFGAARLLGPQYRGLALRAKRWLQQPTYTPPTESTIHDLYRSRRAVRAIYAETCAFERSLAEMKILAERHPFPDIPLTVVAHGFSHWQPNRVESVWHGLQERLAGLSAQGKLVFAPGAGHLIPLDRPDTVVAAIRDVLHQAQGGAVHQAGFVRGGSAATMH